MLTTLGRAQHAQHDFSHDPSWKEDSDNDWFDCPSPSAGDCPPSPSSTSSTACSIKSEDTDGDRVDVDCPTQEMTKSGDARVAIASIAPRLLFSQHEGMVGHWALQSHVPEEIMKRIAPKMPVRSANENILQVIYRGGDAFATPESEGLSTSEYFWLLDIRDRLWVEAQILESKHRHRILPNAMPKQAIAGIVKVALQRVADGMLHLETAFPRSWSAYRRLERMRLSLYQDDHPLKIIQPYLVPTKPRLPNYSQFLLDSYVRRFKPFPLQRVAAHCSLSSPVNRVSAVH